MDAAAKLSAMMPRPRNAFVDESDGRRTEQPGVRELQALRDVDMARMPEEMDLDGLDASARFLDARSHSDDLRLPPPPQPSSNGTELFRTLSASVAKFKKNANQPVAADPAAIAAETRLMAACQGICKFQRQVVGERERPVGELAQSLLARGY